MNNNYIFQINDVNKSYDNFNLTEVNLEIQQGQIVGILGLNGAGKSTLIKIILGLLSPDSGEINFNKIISNDSIYKIGYLPENFSSINEDMTVKQFINFFLDLNDQKINNGKLKKENLIQLLGLAEKLNSKINKLSKGMRTRLGILQALLGDPVILFLDEPTDGLDPQGRRDIINLFKLIKDRNVTIIITSHILTEVENLCDRIIIMNNGKIISDDLREKIMSKKNPYSTNTLEDYFFERIGVNLNVQ